MTVDKLPEACTSFVVDGFKVNDSSYKIYPRLSESDKSNLIQLCTQYKIIFDFGNQQK